MYKRQIEEFEDSLSELKELINDGNEEGIIEFLDNIKKLRDSSILDS